MPDLLCRNAWPMWIYDVETLRFRDVNDAAVAAYGYTREEFLSMTLLDIRPEAELPRLAERVRTAGQEWRGTGPWRHRLKDGRVIDVDVIARPLEFHGRPARVALAREVHEDPRRSADPAELETLPALTGVVAHDLGNQLGIIASYAGLARDQVEPGSPARGDLSEIERAATAAAILTRGLSRYSYDAGGDPGRIEVCAAVRDSAQELQALAGPGTLRIELDDRPCTAALDRLALERVLRNLIVNARDALPQTGGEITVQVRQSSAAPGGAAHEQRVELQVTDNGHGMNDQILARAFDPFFTTGSDRAHAGLGLAIVRGVVRRAGGTIALESELGAGTRLSITLPVTG